MQGYASRSQQGEGWRQMNLLSTKIIVANIYIMQNTIFSNVQITIISVVNLGSAYITRFPQEIEEITPDPPPMLAISLAGLRYSETTPLPVQENEKKNITL